MRLLCVAGARPNYMKVKPVMDAVQARSGQVVLVHTGQHYDPALNRAPAKSSARGPRSAGLARYAGAGGSCTGVAAPLAGIHMLRGDRSILLEATLPGPCGARAGWRGTC